MGKTAGRKRIIEETTVQMTKDAFIAYLATKNPTWPVVFETGTHCRWMEKAVKAPGMKPIVANPARLRMLSESDTKNDRNDARELAQMALADVDLLHPVSLRGETCQQMLRLLKARDAGAYFGPVPKQHQSGEMDMQCHITMAGSEFVRNLMVESARIALWDGAKDTDIKLKGLRICERGGKIAKRKAVIAVARSLVVTAVALLKRPEREYVPLSEKGRAEFEAMRMIDAVA